MRGTQSKAAPPSYQPVHINQFRFRHLTRTPPGGLLGKVFLSCPAGRRMRQTPERFYLSASFGMTGFFPGWEWQEGNLGFSAQAVAE